MTYNPVLINVFSCATIDEFANVLSICAHSSSKHLGHLAAAGPNHRGQLRLVSYES